MNIHICGIYYEMDKRISYELRNQERTDPSEKCIHVEIWYFNILLSELH